MLKFKTAHPDGVRLSMLCKFSVVSVYLHCFSLVFYTKEITQISKILLTIKLLKLYNRLGICVCVWTAPAISNSDSKQLVIQIEPRADETSDVELCRRRWWFVSTLLSVMPTALIRHIQTHANVHCAQASHKYRQQTYEWMLLYATYMRNMLALRMD